MRVVEGRHRGVVGRVLGVTKEEGRSDRARLGSSAGGHLRAVLELAEMDAAAAAGGFGFGGGRSKRERDEDGGGERRASGGGGERGGGGETRREKEESKRSKRERREAPWVLADMRARGG